MSINFVNSVYVQAGTHHLHDLALYYSWGYYGFKDHWFYYIESYWCL